LSNVSMNDPLNVVSSSFSNPNKFIQNSMVAPQPQYQLQGYPDLLLGASSVSSLPNLDAGLLSGLVPTLNERTSNNFGNLMHLDLGISSDAGRDRSSSSPSLP